jgi:hypothetical protein
MARGENTAHHPNRKVGRSDLPRLSGALADYLNASKGYMDEHSEDPEDEFSMSHSIPSLINHPLSEPFSEIDTAEALSKYRQKRDSGQMDSESKELYGHDIREASKGW